MQSMEASDLARQVTVIPIEQIATPLEPPLAVVDAAALRELAASIHRDGLIQPITLRPRQDGRYAVVSGNRRLLACRMCGLREVDAVILPGDPQADTVRRLLDELRGGAMHYLDEAEAIHRLCVQGSMATSALAHRLGCTEQTIADKLRLTELSLPLRTLLRNEGIPPRIAYALLRLPDEEQRMALANQAAREHLSVTDAELLISSRLHTPPASKGGHAIAVVRDERLYLNAIRALVTQMQEAGLNASLDEHGSGTLVQFTISVPKPRHRRSARHRRTPQPTA